MQPAALARLAADVRGVRRRGAARRDRPLLDVACGSGVFSAAVYRHANRPLVLADRSLAMLGRTLGRLGPAAPAVSFVQADLFDLPFAAAGAFETVACHGALHVFDDLPEALRALRAQLAPGGALYVTSLVAETPVAARYLALLHRAGEVATPRRQADLLTFARAELGDVTARRHGAMLLPHRPHLTRPVGS
ncbi:MAG: class I SAM-dependent methyltransferase [Euzebyales bacterium]|nr:class I SAM-dependent methyltransferase [Euzebyales bacterium]